MSERSYIYARSELDEYKLWLHRELDALNDRCESLIEDFGYFDRWASDEMNCFYLPLVQLCTDKPDELVGLVPLDRYQRKFSQDEVEEYGLDIIESQVGYLQVNRYTAGGEAVTTAIITFPDVTEGAPGRPRVVNGERDPLMPWDVQLLNQDLERYRKILLAGQAKQGSAYTEAPEDQN